jgi:hypothetical protein
MFFTPRRVEVKRKILQEGPSCTKGTDSVEKELEAKWAMDPAPRALCSQVEGGQEAEAGGPKQECADPEICICECTVLERRMYSGSHSAKWHMNIECKHWGHS